MLKKQKILIFLLLTLLVLVLYLILTSESVEKINVTEQSQLVEEKIAQLETNYQAQAKPIFIDYEKLAGENNITVDKITELQNKLLALKVPAKFKELHIQLVQALDKMENYLNQKKLEEKTSSWQMINQLKASYGWLDN